MLRRSLLAILLYLLAAGFAFAGELAHAAMQSEPVCAQQDADVGGCASDGMTSEACAVYCASSSACVVSALPAAQLTAATVPPSAHLAPLRSDCRSAPETAPPKALAS